MFDLDGKKWKPVVNPITHKWMKKADAERYLATGILPDGKTVENKKAESVSTETVKPVEVVKPVQGMEPVKAVDNKIRLKDPIYLSSIASSKSSTKYFTDFGGRVGVTVFKQGVGMANGVQSKAQMESAARRFRGLIRRADSIPRSLTEKMSKQDLEHAKQQILKNIPDKKLAQKLIDRLKSSM